jgi:hypothetical protein
VLQEIHPETLPADLHASFSLLYGEWALAQRQVPAAAGALLDPSLANGLNRADTLRLHTLRAKVYEAQQQPVNAIGEWLALSLLVSEPDAQRDTSDAIWRLLTQLSEEDLRFLESADSTNSAEDTLRTGWVALARIRHQDRTSPERQAVALRDWRRSWPLHPANRYMPAEMAALEQQQDSQQRIALLLPLSGKRAAAGQAVRDGFLAAHYRHMTDGTAAAQVDVIDTAAIPDLLNAYQQAVAQGAQLVIGPLEREQVQLLASQPALPVPTLALNNPPQPASGPANLYQFSLNPEDDVRQVAEAAAASRFRKALVIAPQGDRGERYVQAFQHRWELLGGTVSGQMRYTPASGNYSVQLAQALGLDLASGQFRPGSSLPEMIFFAGTPADAAAMVETLARNNAGQVPVYATAQALDARQQAGARINGLRVCLSPWQAGLGPLREAGEQAPADNDLLYAMGADARELYPRLQQLRDSTSLTLPGNTGYLGMDGERRIVRRLIWAVAQDGQLRVLPASSY